MSLMAYATSTGTASAAAPPPRRKSCGGCVKAKRRCDLQLPCSRCAEKGLTCEYLSAGPWRPDQSRNAVAANELDLAALDAMGTDGFGNMVPGLMDAYDLDLDMNLGEGPPLLPGSNALDQMEHHRENSINGPESQSTTTRETFTRADYEDFYELREELDQGKLGNPNSASAYIIDMVRNFPRDMALRMKTPFLHPRLYEDDMPKAILDAFTASSLYTNKNPANEAAVFKVLDANATSLIRQHRPAETRPTRELLIMTQALLFYQIIRVFDGDIRQRGHAENAMPALKEMTMQLEQHRDEYASISCAGPDPPRWDSWLLDECTRRTVLMSYFFLSKYHLLKHGDGEAFHRFPKDIC
ncbi:ras small monomeric [Diplodia corticola]|uniref:Ras small monomeric n=1 Tax=Diplodia corticola TaxID=236234 RepID=A0A1J9QXG8_9PEZI|nr:ras small monomeric [Diplodia corticola]OJD33726.1 ras small monomeric [Diplodia corticola]